MSQGHYIFSSQEGCSGANTIHRNKGAGKRTRPCSKEVPWTCVLNAKCLQTFHMAQKKKISLKANILPKL